MIYLISYFTTGFLFWIVPSPYYGGYHFEISYFLGREQEGDCCN